MGGRSGGTPSLLTRRLIEGLGYKGSPHFLPPQRGPCAYPPAEARVYENRFGPQGHRLSNNDIERSSRKITPPARNS